MRPVIAIEGYSAGRRARRLRMAALAIARDLKGRALLIPGPAVHAGTLSPLLAEMVELIGRELTLAFAREFGDQTIYIPGRNAAPEGRVQRVIGNEAALKLARSFGGLQVCVPCGPDRGPHSKARVIRSLLLVCRAG